MMPKLSTNSIALGNIRGKRRQYGLLMAAIVLAIYFAATMLLFASTMVTSLQEQHYQRMGEQDAIIFHYQDAPLEELIVNGTFSEYGTAKILGYVLPDGRSKNGGFSIAAFDDTSLALARKDTIEGRLPEKMGEIALELSALARLRMGAALGDTITLTLMVPDGTGFLESPVQKSYTLVGILSNKLPYLNRWPFYSPAYGSGFGIQPRCLENGSPGLPFTRPVMQTPYSRGSKYLPTLFPLPPRGCTNPPSLNYIVKE